MSNYQFRSIMCIAWLSVLCSSDGLGMAYVAMVAVSAFAAGAIHAKWKEYRA